MDEQIIDEAIERCLENDTPLSDLLDVLYLAQLIIA